MSDADTWRDSRGPQGETVTVEERHPGSNVYLRWPNPAYPEDSGRRYVRRSLGFSVRNGDGTLDHANVDQALDARDEKYREIRTKPEPDRRIESTRDLTLRQLIRLHYRRHARRNCAPSTRRAYRRTGTALVNYFSGIKDPRAITSQNLRDFLDARKSGAIDARGRPRRHEDYDGGPCGPRGRAKDLSYIRALFNWAITEEDKEGRPLVVRNPALSVKMPKRHKSKVRRPVATHERYEILRAHTDDVRMEIRWNGSREPRRSYVSEILDIVRGTGRRISEVCAIRKANVHLEKSEIHWPGSANKTGNETTVAINGLTRRAVERALDACPVPDSPWLFPAPGDPSKHVTKDLAASWLRRAEEAAEDPLEDADLPAAHDGSLWHAYRRLWATERKHLPDVDVAAAGGWESIQALQDCYIQDDEETIRDVVNTGPAATAAGASASSD